MTEPHNERGPSTDEELIAYLDGELDAEASRRLDARMAADPELRERLKQHQRAWELLDELPRADVGESFTQTTVEMVAVSGAEQADDARRRRSIHTKYAWLLGCLVAVMASLAGYALVASIVAAPDRQLLEDLRVIENLDDYRAVEEIELLRALERESLFADDLSAEPRHSELASMSATEKETLRLQQQRFDRLSHGEREKLRQLDEAIVGDSRRDRLRQVMRSYSEWLRALPSSQRIELVSLPAAERVARVKGLLAEQERQRFQDLLGAKLQLGDQKVLLDWVSGLIERDEARIMRLLTPIERQRLQRIEDSMQRRVMIAMMVRWKTGEMRLFELLRPTAADLKQLATQLSPLARDTLTAARDDQEREQLIQMWARGVIDSRARPAVTKDDLQRFLEEHISDEQRAYLESLPRERMRMELQRLYMRSRFNGPPPPRGN